MTSDLFQQILFAENIHAMAGNFDRPAIVRVPAVKTKPLKYAVDNGIFDGGAQESINPFPAKCGNYRLPAPWVHIDHVAVDGSTSQVLDQSGRAIAREARHLDVVAAFESIRC